ncbi:MAG: hypothetical protein ACFB0B_11625 [Thermonemataceae bacterium]
MSQIQENSLLKIAGIAAFTTAFTTFLLWWLPQQYAPPSNFEEQIQLAQNPYYLARLWVNFVHIPLALMGYLGLAYVVQHKALLRATAGFRWFLIWGTIEMLGIAGIIFTVNKNWRVNYTAAAETEQPFIKAHIEYYMAVWDSQFFVLLIAFLLGTIFFGWATWKSKGLERVVSYLFWLAAPLTIFIILSGYFQVNWLGGLVGVIYPILQPVSRLLLGIFLWRKATSVSSEEVNTI